MDYVIIMLPLGSSSLESKVQFTGIPIQSYLQWLYAEACLTSYMYMYMLGCFFMQLMYILHVYSDSFALVIVKRL